MKNISNFSLALLCAALFGPLTSASATEWGFTLIGSPSAERSGDPDHETIQMTGAGTFDPGKGTASGGGAFVVFNAFDEPDFGGPIIHGTWKATRVISWTPDGGLNNGLQGGTLKLAVTVFFRNGLVPELKGFSADCFELTIICPFVNGAFVESGDAINVNICGLELFDTNHSGLTVFHIIKP